MKVQVLRKTTHTDQYLSFHSHHPLDHKLGVICTLYDWCNIITEVADAAAEITHVEKALKRCRYPKWSFWRVRESVDKKKPEGGARTKKTKEGDRDTKTTVIIPYVKGVFGSP